MKAITQSISRLAISVFLVCAALVLPATAPAADSPSAVPRPVRVRPERLIPLLMPNGELWAFSVPAVAEGRLAVAAIVSKDNGRTWSERRTLVELPKIHAPDTVWGDGIPVVDRATGDLHAFLLRADSTQYNQKKAAFPKIALWHLQAPPPYKTWTEPKLLFDGYIGAQLSSIQHTNGAILAAFAYMSDRTYSTPAQGMKSWIFMGQHTSTTVYSTDRGVTFRRANDVDVPAAILLGNENGAIEPVCLSLADGRIWMLMRTQLGRLWESFSKDGASWSAARPSQFLGSDSPASLTRLSDGRIVIIWNCCQRFPYAYGGRQVLHAAISANEGRTWDGFRELLRDPHRLEPAIPIRGDYGSGYPIAAATADDKLLVAAGQGPTQGMFLLDPAWITEDKQSDDFSNGLEAWSAYGTKGVELVTHPQMKGARVLKLERTDHELPAGAVWNFPNGRAGSLAIRFQAVPGPVSTSITLTDHFSSPFDREGELNGLFTLSLAQGASLPDGRHLETNEWHDLELSWDMSKRICRASIDGAPWKELPQLKLVTEGANYLRFRVLSDQPAKGGILVERVAARIDSSASASPAEVPR